MTSARKSVDASVEGAIDAAASARHGNVTLRAVAAHAGVSKSVVSRVLQGAHNVSDPKRLKVEAAIRELGYRPNATARSLTQRRTRAIGVLVNDLRQPWFVDFLEGLNSTLHQHELHALIGDGRLDKEVDERLLRAFMEMRVDGLVLAGTMSVTDTIREATGWLPTAVAGSRDLHRDQLDVVAEDDAAGTVQALDHLRTLGHTHIHHIAGEQGQVFAIRRESYEAWMDRHGLGAHARFLECDTTHDGGFSTAGQLLDLPEQERPTALLVANDLAAIGAMSAAKGRGLDVPRDLSVIGFDNTNLAKMPYIWLTSVDVAAREVGIVTARMLVERIADPTLPAREWLATPELIVRGTTAAPPLSERPHIHM